MGFINQPIAGGAFWPFMLLCGDLWSYNLIVAPQRELHTFTNYASICFPWSLLIALTNSWCERHDQQATVQRHRALIKPGCEPLGSGLALQKTLVSFDTVNIHEPYLSICITQICGRYRCLDDKPSLSSISIHIYIYTFQFIIQYGCKIIWLCCAQAMSQRRFTK